MISTLADTPSARQNWQWHINQCLEAPDALKSNLTAIGDPAEFQVSWHLGSGADAIRATIDPNAMSLPSVRRERCTALVSGLTTPQLTAAQALSELISNTSLRFGGWVGIRENSLGFYRKLYLETPPVLTRLDCPEAQIFCDLTQNLRAAKCLMLGLDPSDHSVEVYFSAAPISVPIFKDLLRQTNLSQFTESAIGVIAQLSGQNARPFLPTDQNGISLSLDKNNNVDALTWYTHADHLLGPPEKARETLMEFGQAHGLNMNRYAEMSRLGRETRWHGVLGVTLKRGSGVFLSITCASHTLGVLQ